MRDIVILFILLSFAPSYAQGLLQLDASKIKTQVPPHNLKMGTTGTKEKELHVNSRFLSFNGRPIILMMGEVHYSRLPSSQWEDVILRMKAGGVNIIASYVIWIHHEELEVTHFLCTIVSERLVKIFIRITSYGRKVCS